MGHYASEMSCPKCNQLRCVCPPKRDKSLHEWVIDYDYTVIQADEFEKKHDILETKFGGISGHGFGRRMGRQHFSSQKKALTQAAINLQKDIDEAKKEVHRLEKIQNNWKNHG